MNDQATRMVYAEPGNRVGAKLADMAAYTGLRALIHAALVYGAGLSVNDTGFTPLLLAGGWAAHHAYDTVFTAWFGGTPGKLLLGMRVTRPDGAPVGWRRALCRSLAEWLSRLTLGLGYAAALMNPERRTLHDVLCDTVVVDVSRKHNPQPEATHAL